MAMPCAVCCPFQELKVMVMVCCVGQIGPQPSPAACCESGEEEMRCLQCSLQCTRATTLTLCLNSTTLKCIVLF